MSSNTVYEFEDIDTRFPDPSEASTGEAPTEYQSDSDSDIENEMIRSLFNEGKKRKEQKRCDGCNSAFSQLFDEILIERQLCVTHVTSKRINLRSIKDRAP